MEQKIGGALVVHSLLLGGQGYQCVISFPKYNKPSDFVEDYHFKQIKGIYDECAGEEVKLRLDT